MRTLYGKAPRCRKNGQIKEGAPAPPVSGVMRYRCSRRKRRILLYYAVLSVNKYVSDDADRDRRDHIDE